MTNTCYQAEMQYVRDRIQAISEQLAMTDDPVYAAVLDAQLKAYIGMRHAVRMAYLDATVDCAA